MKIDTDASPAAGLPPTRRSHTHTKACAVCGDAFKAHRSTAKFCSATCRKRASRGDVTLSATHPPRHAKEALSESQRSPEGHSSGAPDPQWIESAWTGRVWPNSYAELGLPFPDHLRVKRTI